VVLKGVGSGVQNFTVDMVDLNGGATGSGQALAPVITSKPVIDATGKITFMAADVNMGDVLKLISNGDIVLSTLQPVPSTPLNQQPTASNGVPQSFSITAPTAPPSTNFIATTINVSDGALSTSLFRLVLGTDTNDIIILRNLRIPLVAFGYGGDDTLSGSVEILDDTLVGGGGNDTLIGNQGADILSGGAGVDTFLFADNGAGNGKDTITDLAVSAGGDVLEFTNFDIDRNNSAGPLLPALDPVYKVNPDAPVDIAGKIIRLVDIAGGQDITTEAGLQTALATGGEYANLDMTARKAVIITSATDGADVNRIFFADAGTTGVINISLVGTTTNTVDINGYVAANFVI
jgi:Ca2+-binding RTX toxin-like protein